MDWLATLNYPDIGPALTFIASYSNTSYPQHYKAEFHALKYLTSTDEYSIYFHSNSYSTIQTFNDFPHHHYKDAYTEATTPSSSEFHQLTAFCNSNWGGKFGSEVKEGTPLGLYKFCSLYFFLICCSGGPIASKSIRQNQTALSYCESKIMSTK